MLILCMQVEEFPAGWEEGGAIAPAGFIPRRSNPSARAAPRWPGLIRCLAGRLRRQYDVGPALTMRRQQKGCGAAAQGF